MPVNPNKSLTLKKLSTASISGNLWHEDYRNFDADCRALKKKPAELLRDIVAAYYKNDRFKNITLDTLESGIWRIHKKAISEGTEPLKKQIAGLDDVIGGVFRLVENIRDKALEKQETTDNNEREELLNAMAQLIEIVTDLKQAITHPDAGTAGETVPKTSEAVEHIKQTMQLIAEYVVLNYKAGERAREQILQLLVAPHLMSEGRSDEEINSVANRIGDAAEKVAMQRVNETRKQMSQAIKKVKVGDG